MRLPSGVEVSFTDRGMRQMVVPIGTTLRVPKGQTWRVVGMAVLPAPNYEAPSPGCDRNAQAWGEVCLRTEKGIAVSMNTLTLMDRYWGRYNLLPDYPDVIARLEHVSQAMRAAPTVPELLAAVEMACDSAYVYTTKIAPVIPWDAGAPPLEVEGGAFFVVEYMTEPEKIDRKCTLPDGTTIPVKLKQLADVELTVFVKMDAE